MPKPKRIYWDACAWIAFIAEEKSVPLKGGGTENRYAMCLATLEAARKGQYEIVTSAFTLAEVCKNPQVVVSPIDNLPSFFEKSYILIVPVDLSIGRRAQAMQASGLIKLKPPDAVHLASAQRAKVLELHTFDDKILALDGTLVGGDGGQIKICRPTEGTSIGPLFDVPEGETGSEL